MASDSVLHTSKGAQPTGFHCNASERVVRVDGRFLAGMSMVVPLL